MRCDGLVPPAVCCRRAQDMPKITLKWLREGSWAVQSKLHELFPASLHLKAPYDSEGLRIKGEYGMAADDEQPAAAQ
eukprot:COSAG01_NODE_12498_length_1729_cov_1.257669_3_plen_77_part_00